MCILKSGGFRSPLKTSTIGEYPTYGVFSRKGRIKPITDKTADYVPGDIVCWNLGGSITHNGFVVNKKSANNKRCLIAPNIGAGQVLAHCLFGFKIIRHYRYQKE